jgi:hypothetical protein
MHAHARLDTERTETAEKRFTSVRSVGSVFALASREVAA